MKRKVAEIILILLFYLIQVTFGNAIGIGGITPNLLIILPVLFGFFKGRNEGMLVGFLSGVMYDLFFSSLFGFSYFADLVSNKKDIYAKQRKNAVLDTFARNDGSAGKGIFDYVCNEIMDASEED